MTSAPTNRPPGSRAGDSLLLPGMWVEVLPASQIVQTLDADQSLEGLPFMPEMLPYCGRRYRVALRAERTCVHPPAIPFRRLQGAVVLQGLRCDGSLHGGCQLGCMLFWKEAWLRKVPAGRQAETGAEPTTAPALLIKSRSDPELYFCQATALPRATTPGDPFWKPGQYLRLLQVRTFTLSELLTMFARPGGRRIARLLRSLTRRRAVVEVPKEATLGLEPGEWVEVKGREEILQTLDARRMHKGLAFGGDMYEQCGRRMRVRKRVDRIIEEETGRLRPVHDTVILEGSVCDRYFGCARGMPFLWREPWLKRVEPRPLSDAMELGQSLGGAES
jgi:hypothetical protein